MTSNNIAFTGVTVAGMSRTLHAFAGASVAQAYQASAAAASAAWPAAAIPAPRKRHDANATRTSVNRGTT